MRRFRLSIAGLLVVVAVAAVGFAAIRVASAAWSGALYSLTFFLLIGSLLGIGFGRGTRRTFWIGFAALGWGYVVLHYVPWNGRYLGPYLLAPNLFEELYDRIHIPDEVRNAKGFTPAMRGMRGDGAPAGSGFSGMGMGGGFRMMAGFGGPAAPGPTLADPLVFDRIGMALEALIWAFLGGWMARYFAAGRVARPMPDAATPATPEP